MSQKKEINQISLEEPSCKICIYGDFSGNLGVCRWESGPGKEAVIRGFCDDGLFLSQQHKVMYTMREYYVNQGFVEYYEALRRVNQ